jgi:ligand-binding SRPBCC domain-containing protein
MGMYQLYWKQKIPAGIDTLWDFISSPQNLKQITPTHLGFDIITQNLADKIYPGMLITYKVRPLFGIKLTWVTEITHVKEKSFFIDEQRVGPYRIWHHEHRLEVIDGGVLMSDFVSYFPKMGTLGDLANSLFIRKKLKEIFNYRERAMHQIFGVFGEE